MTYFATIALAEQAVIDAGFKRDPGRAMWVNAANKTARVTYISPGRFQVEWS